MNNPQVNDKVSVFNTETGRYVSATVVSVYNGPRQARVSIDGTDDVALLVWADIRSATKSKKN